ncbi:MAG: phosphopantetheine-binding protein [bacterium]
MTDQEIIETINRALQEEFELTSDAMRPEAHLITDLGLDSLDYVDMVIVLQNAFHLKIRDEKGLREIRTLGDVHAFVLNKRRELVAAGESPAPDHHDTTP